MEMGRSGVQQRSLWDWDLGERGGGVVARWRMLRRRRRGGGGRCIGLLHFLLSLALAIGALRSMPCWHARWRPSTPHVSASGLAGLELVASRPNNIRPWVHASNRVVVCNRPERGQCVWQLFLVRYSGNPRPQGRDET